jgi:hypothetical protein
MEFSGDRDGSSAILRRGRRRDLRGESGVSFAFVGPDRARRPNAQMPGAKILLRRSGTDYWRDDVRAGFPWNSESAPVPRRGAWMSTRRHGSCSGASVRALFPGKRVITRERVEEIEIVARHGIYLAPLYNADGPMEHGLKCHTEWSRG